MPSAQRKRSTTNASKTPSAKCSESPTLSSSQSLTDFGSARGCNVQLLLGERKALREAVVEHRDHLKAEQRLDARATPCGHEARRGGAARRVAAETVASQAHRLRRILRQR